MEDNPEVTSLGRLSAQGQLCLAGLLHVLSKIILVLQLWLLLRPLLVTLLGIAAVGVALWSVAGLVALSNITAFVPGQLAPRPHPQTLKQTAIHALVDYVSTDKGARQVSSKLNPVVTVSITNSIGKSSNTKIAFAKPTRFDVVVQRAGQVNAVKLAALFREAEAYHQPAIIPVTDNAVAKPHQTALAYIDPTLGGAADAVGTALSTLLVNQRSEDLITPGLEVDANSVTAVTIPDFENTPSAAPLPQRRPQSEQTEKNPDVTEISRHEAVKADELEPVKPQAITSIKPYKSAQRQSIGTLGQTLRNLFGDNGNGSGIRSGSDIAVYDISASKVYMPDGSVLNAHSGIGNMADNPKYVHVKMNGPTPPHTYNLRMREKRFHGVEAIRMLPVDGKNKFGRDGFLTHSYLLRDGREGSHGCVAFADYSYFLAAFKAGKVKQMIVVPSGGRETFLLASSGKYV